MTNLATLIRDISDFPKPGILFKDITPLLADATGLKEAIQQLTTPFTNQGITHVAAMESRGFIFGVPVAMALNAGFVPIRKPGKLPHQTISRSFSLEYGEDTLEMHQDAVDNNATVLVVDDLLATGGTAQATVELIQSTGARVAACAFVVELDFLNGREKLAHTPIHTLLHY